MGREKIYQVGDYWLSKQSRSNSWCRTWYDVKHSQTRRASLGTEDLPTAKEKLTQWFIANAQGETEVVAEAQLDEILLKYWERHAKQLDKNGSIRSNLAYWNEYHSGKTVAQACDFQTLNDFKQWLLDKDLAASSVNHILSSGRAALRMAWERGELSAVPHVKMLEVKNTAPKGLPLSHEEARAFYQELPPHLQTASYWLLATAARPSAIYDLQWLQVEVPARIVHLNAPGREQNKKYRPTVKMPHTLVGACTGSESGFVCAYRGKPLGSPKTALRKARARAGLSTGVNMYSWRHTVARWMRSQGVPSDQIKMQLGHSVFDGGVSERYAPYDPAYLREAVESIDQLLCELRVSYV